MANNKKLVNDITSMEEDFSKWYTDVVKKAELVDYSLVKGCVILRPYACAIWENITADLDRRFKETGHENVCMPLLIPESLLQKEKDHVEGFAPEALWITHAGNEKLAERLCIRPTSEVLFCEHYKNIIHSYRDLPKKYNQWCSVVRWEKTTRPFLRTTEFYWQEGHTMHETAEEAINETLGMLEIYTAFFKDFLAIPAVTGKKTEKEKFNGAVSTYTIEPMMHNGVALQGGTTHYFGDGFSKAFDITFTGRDNKANYPHQTSWGVSTRMIGALIMTHGDDNGLVLPPKVAPTQVIIIPVAQHKEGVLDRAYSLLDSLKTKFRASIDASDNSPGFKYADCEMRGIPLRVEIGPRDIENNQCVVVRRDNNEKIIVNLDELNDKIDELLLIIHNDMYNRALKNQIEKTHTAVSYDEFLETAQNKPGFIKAMWCGDVACEEKIKDETGGVKSRCIVEEEKLSDTCVCCGKPAKHLLYWGKQY